MLIALVIAKVLCSMPMFNNDRTGIFLSKNVPYIFRIEEVEDWVDCTIEDATPETGRPIVRKDAGVVSNFVNILGWPLTYSKPSGYMELLGEVSGQQFRLGKLSSSEAAFIPKQDGELILRVNEPRFMESVYQNNFWCIKANRSSSVSVYCN